MIILAYSSAALFTGFVLDMLFGDPYRLPHIVRLMGNSIAALEKLLRRILPPTADGERLGGILLVVVAVFVYTGLSFSALAFSYNFCPPLGYALESFLCYQLLAAKSLKTESMKVYKSLRDGDIEGARENVAMLVGRDTDALDGDGVTRAAVETVAENASDGVTAPLMYAMLGGAPLGLLYKAVNTMDSMIGYKNDKYLYFGYAAAKADDILNYIPSRLCALFMIISAYILRLDGKNAFYIWRRDRRKHASPNSAQTEAACAGALRIRLAGPASYFGKIYDRPYIGDAICALRYENIADANRLMYLTSVFTLIIALLFRAVCLGVVFFGTV